MRKLINYLRGTVRVAVVGAFPERIINLCAQNGVEFWAVDWRDEHTVVMTLRLRGLERLQNLAQRVGCEVQVLWKGGLPEFAGKFRRRYAFLIGLALALCAVSLLSMFVLTVEVSGNETVSDAVILQQLQRFGVRPGAFGPGLDRRQIEQEILKELKELSWMAINLYGTRVEVVVREAQSPPKRVDETGHYHIVAEADGIVTHVEPELGDSLVKEGDTVLKGEILISGTVTLEPPQYSGLPERYYPTHARGRVWARTWRSLTAVIPEETTGKAYTGRERSVWSLNFFGWRVEFFGNSSNLDGFYDRITSVRQAALPGGEMLPLWLTREQYREYEPELLTVDRDAAADLLKEQLACRLTQLVGADGEVLNVGYTTRVANGLIQVTAEAECLEEIGREVAANEPMNSGEDPDIQETG